MTIKTQKELDNILLDYDGEIIIKTNDTSKTLSVNKSLKKIKVMGKSVVELHSNSEAKFYDHSFGIMYEKSNATLYDNAYGEYYDKSKGIAKDNSNFLLVDHDPNVKDKRTFETKPSKTKKSVASDTKTKKNTVTAKPSKTATSDTKAKKGTVATKPTKTATKAKPSPKKPISDEILISINPKYVEMILCGEKQFEFRKTAPEIKKLYIYETAPKSKVVADVIVLELITGTLESVWKKTRKFAGMTKKEYTKYFEGKDVAYAYKLGKIKKYRKLKELDYYGLKKAPQNYAFVKSH